jgi:hypothetical protein
MSPRPTGKKMRMKRERNIIRMYTSYQSTSPLRSEQRRGMPERRQDSAECRAFTVYVDLLLTFFSFASAVVGETLPNKPKHIPVLSIVM